MGASPDVVILEPLWPQHTWMADHGGGCCRARKYAPGRRQLHLHHSTHRERLTWLEGQLEFPLFSAQIVSGWVQRCRRGASPGLPITNGDRVRP